MENRELLIIDCQNAHKDILKTQPLKEEIRTIEEAYAVAYIPVNGAVSINDFKEQDEFRFGMVGLQVNGVEPAYNIPVEFVGIQGRALAEEQNSNFNKIQGYNPLPINREINPNSNLKIKFRNSLTEFSFKFNLKIILTYTER